MTKQTAPIAYPLPPHPETLRDPASTILGEAPGGRVLVTYCRRNQAGAVYHLEQQLWRIWTPVAFREFAAALHAAGIRLPEGEDTQRWIDAATAPPEPPN